MSLPGPSVQDPEGSGVSEVPAVPLPGLLELMLRNVNPFAQSLNRNWDA